METFRVKDKSAVKIFAKKIREQNKSILFDCEGDKVWFPKSSVEILDNETILLQESVYKEKILML